MRQNKKRSKNSHHREPKQFKNDPREEETANLYADHAPLDGLDLDLAWLFLHSETRQKECQSPAFRMNGEFQSLSAWLSWRS